MIVPEVIDVPLDIAVQGPVELAEYSQVYVNPITGLDTVKFVVPDTQITDGAAFAIGVPTVESNVTSTDPVEEQPVSDQ